MIVYYRVILKTIEIVAGCFIIWLNAPKKRMKKAIFAEWAEQAWRIPAIFRREHF